jgi:geranylgeranyl reductase family protein
MLGNHHDAVIIGAGPAGSMTAYHLAKAGLRVALLEAKQFPRDKACGGGLLARTVQRVPIDLRPILRGAMHRVSVTLEMRDVHTRSSQSPLVYTVLRSEFDHYLMRAAEEAGATVLQGVRARGFETDDAGRATVFTDNGALGGDCLVGADGANSVVSRLLNARDNFYWQAAVYCEVPADLLNSSAVGWDCMNIDWGTFPSGYAWAFPKRDYVNIGAGGPIRIARHLRNYAAKFSRACGLVKSASIEGLHFTGHQLPSLTERTRVAAGNTLLVGDAAGLVDPFTGDGLCLAFRSAEIAASCIVEALGRGSRILDNYRQKLMADAASELRCARNLLSLSTIFPSLMYRLFRYNDRAWARFCRILQGTSSFVDLKSEILGPLRFASGLVDFVAERWERQALKRMVADDILRAL